MKRAIISILALTVLCSCTSMATRIKQENYAYWPAHIQQAVDNGMIIPGMNKLQVLAVTDVPEVLVQKRTQFIEDKILETWILYKSIGGYFYANPGFAKIVIINFRGGIVDSVSF